MVTGGLCAMMVGQPLMPMWPADSLDTPGQVSEMQCLFCCTCYGFMLILFYSADATAYSNAHFGPNSNIIIALDDVACTTAQSRVIDCTHDSNTGDCSHTDDAGVQCVPSKSYCLMSSLTYVCRKQASSFESV